MKYLPLALLLVLVVAGLVWLRRRRLRLLEDLTETLSAMRVGQDPGQLLAEMMEKLRGILGARTVSLFFYDAEEEQLYRFDGEGGPRSKVPSVENTLWIDFTDPARVERLAAPHRLLERLEAERALSLSWTARGHCARLLLLDPQSDPGPRAGVLLLCFMQLLFGVAEQAFLLQRVRSQALDEERARMAQDFHDGPLQTFISFDIHLQYVRQLWERDPQRAAEELESLRQLARRQGRELREMIQEMRPVDVEGATLVSVLRRAVDDTQKSGDLSVRFLDETRGLAVPRKIIRQVYQVLREALNNASKHARARNVVVCLEQGQGFFTLTIDDDGEGFSFSGRHTLEEMDRMRIGPVSIKQRARQMGADLEVESTPGHGSRLILRVPLEAAATPLATPPVTKHD